MNIEEALNFIDHLLGNSKLTNVQEIVFRCSLQRESYAKIAERYGYNYDYLKQVGSELWQLLSELLDTPVSKNNLYVVLRKRLQKPNKIDSQLKIFLGYTYEEVDSYLAEELERYLANEGYQIFAVHETSIERNDLLQNINTELQQCHFFIVLLSTYAVASEMITELVRRAKSLQASSLNRRPKIVFIKVGTLPIPLSYELRTYLRDSQSLGEWRSQQDTPRILAEISHLLEVDSEEPIESRESANAQDNEQSILSLEIANPEEAILATHTALNSHKPSLPLPTASPEFPTGQVPLDSQFYIERPPMETRCAEEINRPGSLIRIKAARQMGKTSLMARILHNARSQNTHTVAISFQLADSEIFTNLERFLRWFCVSVGHNLGLPNQLSEFWDDVFGNSYNCTDYFENYLLAKIDKPLVLGLDEVDRVFLYRQIADDFFALLRGWHEKARYGDGSSELWQKLRLIVVHSTEVYIPLNVNQSPFNVGIPIELPELTIDQVSDLARRHNLNWNRSQVESLMNLVGGHPYLVRLALYHIACREIEFNQLLYTGSWENGIYRDHLRYHLWQLYQHPELIPDFRQVVYLTTPVELNAIQAFRLQSMGLVKLQGNLSKIRCNLYRQYFSDRLR